MVNTEKSFKQACEDFENAVMNHDFAVLHVHDLGKTLRAKGIIFEQNCKLFEVCNPRQTANILLADIGLNMLLPYRISVYADKDKTKIGLIKSGGILTELSDNLAFIDVFKQIEHKIIQIVDEAK
jgi:uncharacterized protein (DUF302 family)